MDLSNRVAIITGGARGLGGAIADELSRAGARVVVADVDRDAATEKARRLQSNGSEATTFPIDVSRPSEARELVAATLKQFGRLDILVNNAGICPLAPIEEVTEDLFDRVMAVNLKGVFFVSQAVVAPFKAQHSGKIVNISSVSGKTGGFMPLTPYAATKAGVISLTKSFAAYLAPYGVNVNAIAPGPAETDLTKDWPADSVTRLTNNIPFKRFARPEDIAPVAAFLASDQAAYLTGEIVDVNGGLFMD
jgi:3-oxoacyl-[acyl-carrier protein] reductase